ncbi:hypothetical protein F5879DRAFT_970875 [Lentinula edodes]|uniref:uncharacterized protein n=1 Tax=Lentinula edodes TaxID=5353 RepID=UPI001E8E6100|nr:uncharacterized protein C8R40DRAFT_1092133 [Lentinula edodes]KAH7878364.1 hypothetical protein C8R40DRAFT_1092133 [Lentinula edodes]KAJ3900849.1 hypothetical protein F5879DRAFT_970875 [Lentinula edodes]
MTLRSLCSLLWWSSCALLRSLFKTVEIIRNAIRKIFGTNRRVISMGRVELVSARTRPCSVYSFSLSGKLYCPSVHSERMSCLMKALFEHQRAAHGPTHLQVLLLRRRNPSDIR